MGAQAFVLPYLDSITGFTVLFAAVTAISAWIATSTPRLSYLGVQVAFAFYLIHLQEFAPQTSLSIARDRVVGVLLGLTCMWLIFDRLWAKDALQEMQDEFCLNLEMLAELFQPSRHADRELVAKRATQLWKQITHGFTAVQAQSDAVLFEFGQSRKRKLKIRDDFSRWQPTLGILLQVQVTYLQYLAELRTSELPPGIVEAQGAFEEEMRRVIHKLYEQSGAPIPSGIADMITLSQNLSAIATPLYRDLHATFTNP